MSFVDLATVAVHRRHEMESRVNSFLGRCDQTINHIKKLKEQARGIIHQLNCDPSELKDRYLKCIMQLEDYVYLITDVDLALVDKLGEKCVMEYTPVQDTSLKCLTPTVMAQPFNIMDVLSEPVPSTSTACPNFCPAEKDKPKKHKKLSREETLIVFSSASTSNESMPTKSSHSKSQSPISNPEHSNLQSGSTSPCIGHSNLRSGSISPYTEHSNVKSGSSSCTPKNEMLKDDGDVRSESANKLEKEVQCDLVDSLEELDVAGSNSAAENLPAQSLLEENQVYPATILNVDGTSFWVVLNPLEDFSRFFQVMTLYYNDPLIQAKGLDMDQLNSLTYCAFFDVTETDMWYRGLLLQYDEDEGKVEVFLVDTGEVRMGDVSVIRPLAAAFFDRPPYARCCHLAGVELSNSEETQSELSGVLEQYVGTPCSIRIDDNTSESFGVYVLLPGNVSLGDMLVEEGLAQHLEEPARVISSTPAAGPPELHAMTTLTTGPPEIYPLTTSELELLDMDCPEHEDPLEAVTGYSNRDEADICKHYKGGPDKTCFKGAKCKKKHIMHHPDGWTLDKVEVVAKCELLPLPAPDTWLRVHVTCVQHFDTLYVQVVRDDDAERELPCFGVLRPPASLADLVLDMNSPAQRMEYKPFTVAPAPGELVAAIYPFDGQYYRARVLLQTRADQNVEVIYIDYGNTISVREDKLFTLPMRYETLPAQAMLCRLAGVAAKTQDSKQWAAAKKALTDLVLEQNLEAHVIARDYDEITVELFDKKGVSIAEELHSRNMVDLFDFQVIDDSGIHKLVVP